MSLKSDPSPSDSSPRESLSGAATPSELASLSHAQLRARLDELASRMASLNRFSSARLRSEELSRLSERAEQTLPYLARAGGDPRDWSGSLSAPVLILFLRQNMDHVSRWAQKKWLRWSTLKRLGFSTLAPLMTRSPLDLSAKTHGSLSADLAKALEISLCGDSDISTALRLMRRCAAHEGWDVEAAVSNAIERVEARENLALSALQGLRSRAEKTLSILGLNPSEAQASRLLEWARQAPSRRSGPNLSAWSEAIFIGLDQDEPAIVAALLTGAQSQGIDPSRFRLLQNAERDASWMERWQRKPGLTRQLTLEQACFERMAARCAKILLDSGADRAPLDESERSDLLMAAAASCGKDASFGDLFARACLFSAESARRLGMAPAEARESVSLLADQAIAKSTPSGARSASKIARLERAGMLGSLALNDWERQARAASPSEEISSPRRAAARL